MPPDQLQPLLVALTTTVSKLDSGDSLQDSIDALQQLVEALAVEPLHPLALNALSPSLAVSLLPLLRSSSDVSSPTLALVGAALQDGIKKLGEVYSPEGSEERFDEGKQNEGEAVEGVVEALLSGLKSYVGVEDRLDKQAMSIVAKYCYRPLVGVLSASKARAALQRKTLDILDYTISHHASNKSLLVSSSLLGASRLGDLVLARSDHAVCERAMELSFRLRDGLLTDKQGGSKQEKEAKVKKWDDEMWRGLGSGQEKEELLARWREIKRLEYAEHAAEVLGLLTARDLSHFQLVRALTLNANGQDFIELDDDGVALDPSASFDQVVSFNRSTFTASTTSYAVEDDPVVEMLELDLGSVERVKIEKGGEGPISIHISSLHAPTLDSKPMSLGPAAEHHVSFTIRAEDLKQLTKVLSTRDLHWETNKPSSRKPKTAALPTPVKSPQLTTTVKRQPAKSKITAQKQSAAGKGKHDSQSAPTSKSKEVKVSNVASTKQAVAEIPVKPAASKDPASKASNKPLAPAATRPLPSKTSAEQPRPLPRSTEILPATVAEGVTGEKSQKSKVAETMGSQAARAAGSIKRKVAAGEGRQRETFPWEAEEVEGGAGQTKKKQKVDESGAGARPSKSVAFEQGAVKSPLQQRMSALANSPRIPPAAVPCRPPARRRRSVESGPITLAPDSDAIDYDDSGYLTGAGVEDKVDVVMDGESASDEDENDELLEMASQIMQTGTSKEKKRFLARLRRGAVAGVGSSDNGEADDEGATEAIEMAVPARKIPAPVAEHLGHAERHSPAADLAPEQPQLVRFSPIKVFQHRPLLNAHRQPFKGKSKTKSTGETGLGGVGRQSKDKTSHKAKGSPRVPSKASEQHAGAGVGQEAMSVDPHEEHIWETLMQLSEVVLHNYVNRRETTRRSFGASRHRIEQNAYKLSKGLNDKTYGIAHATQQQVTYTSDVASKLQQLKVRSKGFGDDLRRALA